MKSAYEIAMERLEATSGPGKQLTDDQKSSIARIDNIYDAKCAECQLSFDSKLAVTPPQEQAALKEQMAAEMMSIESKREEEKEAVWNQAG